MDVWLIPDAPPVIPPVTTGSPQLYVVPNGTISPDPVMGDRVNGAVPLHIVEDLFAIFGLGFTVMEILKEVPMQDPTSPDVGITE
jgi:hypothetical protein